MREKGRRDIKREIVHIDVSTQQQFCRMEGTLGEVIHERGILFYSRQMIIASLATTTM